MSPNDSHDPSDDAADDLSTATALAEASAAEPDDTLPSSGLLSFYDRLRERIVAAVERRGGKLGTAATEALLLVPDIFILMVRLVLDKDVPKAKRALLTSALAYFVLPVDLLPEALLGPTGFTEDLILAVAVLANTFGSDLELYTAKYWSGSKRLREVLRDILTTADSLVGSNIYGRLRVLLRSLGIEVEEMEAAAAEA